MQDHLSIICVQAVEITFAEPGEKSVKAKREDQVQGCLAEATPNPPPRHSATEFSNVSNLPVSLPGGWDK